MPTDPNRTTVQNRIQPPKPLGSHSATSSRARAQYSQQRQQNARQQGSRTQSSRQQNTRPQNTQFVGGGFNDIRYEEPQRAPKKGKGKIIAGVVAGLVVVAYAAGAFAFSQVLYPNTKISGVDVSMQTAGTAASNVNAAWKDYSMEITGDGFSWKFSPQSSEPIIDGDAAVKKVLSDQNSLTWPVGLIKHLTGAGNETSAESSSIDLSADIDTSLLSSSFDQASFEEQLGATIDEFNATRSGTFDTASAYDEDQGQFTVDKARSNEKLNRDNVIKLALIELSQLSETADLASIGTDAYEPLNGSLTDENIQTACDNANALLGVNVNLKLNGSTVSTVDGKTAVQWLKFDDALNPTIDSDALSSWATDMAKSFNTVGTTRSWTRADGKACSVSGGTYGWSVDVDSTVTAITDAINNKQTGDIELTYKTKGDKYTAQGEADWGAYIDVDLSEQHARYYDESGNIVWESGFISGNPNKGNATPQGVYCINSNNGGTTLIGAKDANGNPEYETDVSYWMPFEGNLVGFHDASWQSTANFSNPSAYLSVGSHGCINLPVAKAQELSAAIHVGLCVVVHS